MDVFFFGCLEKATTNFPHGDLMVIYRGTIRKKTPYKTNPRRGEIVSTLLRI